MVGVRLRPSSLRDCGWFDRAVCYDLIAGVQGPRCLSSTSVHEHLSYHAEYSTEIKGIDKFENGGGAMRVSLRGVSLFVSRMVLPGFVFLPKYPPPPCLHPWMRAVRPNALFSTGPNRRLEQCHKKKCAGGGGGGGGRA